MGRIQKVLEEARRSNAKRSAESVTEVIKPQHSIDFSALPIVVPDEHSLEKNHVVAALKDAPDRTAYKVLRTRVLQRLRASRFNVIGVTAASPGEGKTLTAINFAFSLAQDVNHQVVLLDLDLRRPSVHEYLDISPPKDLFDLLDGSAKLEEVLVCPNANRMAVITCQSPIRDSSEVLSSPEMASLIHQLKSLGQNTITVVDLPPALASDDVIAISPLMDALMLVVAQGQCRRDDLREAEELLREYEILGVVLNQSRDKTAAAGYYDNY